MIAPAQKLRASSIAASIAVASLALASRGAAAQQRDSLPAADSARPGTRLETVRVIAPAAPRTVTFLPDRFGAMLLVGKRSEAVLVDSVGANTAQNVARQVLGRVPGLNVAETEGSGFPSNGIALRGLNPTQSVEMNVRQDGVIIAADPYGYPETYYSPPMEAVERIEIVRGSGALQYGPQLGGVVNYVMRTSAPGRALAVDAQHTAGSFGLANTYLSLGTSGERWRWFSYAQRRADDGWRPNSDYRQTSAYAALTVDVTPTLSGTASYSLLRNRIHMPGGLSDAQFAGGAGARRSYRSRNWLTSPWNVASVALDWRAARNVRVQSVTSVLGSSRSLVWRNEDGGPGALDEIDPATGQFVPREVGREGFRNATEELRVLADYRLFGARSSLATGVRWFNGAMHRQGGGEGTTGSDFDLDLASGTYGYDIRFANANVAAWAENAIHLGTRLTLLPGLRLETLSSRADGYTDTTFAPQSKRRTVPLAGLGASFIASATTGVYANVTQGYRPIDYSSLTPVGSVSRIDPSLRDTKAVNADLGWRGTLADDRVRFDVGVFRLAIDGRIGLVSRTDAGGATFTERTNVANSIHQGLESYVELTPLAIGGTGGGIRRSVTVFNSLALIDARYTSGEFDGKRVEYAPRAIERAGVTLAAGPLGTTLLASHVGSAFGDANNTVRSDDAVVGVIPAYTVLDWSATARLGAHVRVQAGVNNVADRKYFTRRTDEYPGPGIIPALGRSGYVSLRLSP
ncbi:MAG TPA: TonB-dependent receptor [Gemmatimonadaceae bacterium]|nr:TonB-dependent receptor [Gemmatimonadaceae bacterium]